MAIATFLLIAWILTLFSFEKIIIQAFKELFNKDITNASYYFLFLMIGIFGDIVLLLQGTYSEVFLR